MPDDTRSSVAAIERFYPIGTPGEPWNDAHRAAWRAGQRVRRSYADEVRAALEALPSGLSVARYGALPIDPARYPLFAVTSDPVDPARPWALVTGGVHGYETSGVQGALGFLREAARGYAGRLNLLVAPCVSPWGYEVVQRWNPDAVDPNRSFRADSPSKEAAALMDLVARTSATWLVHIDLHETTDGDEAEFRPALAARDGVPFEPGSVPDGFYVVGDAASPRLDLQRAIVDAVARVTHVAPADTKGQIIGADVVAPGVILYPFAELGLCAGITRAPFTSTTEVYPDSPRVTPAICVAAQVAAVRAALDHALAAGTSPSP